MTNYNFNSIEFYLKVDI